LEVRRDTIGAKPSFAILETAMNLPDEAVYHPDIVELSVVAVDMILLGNVSGDAIFPFVTGLTIRFCLGRTSLHTT
jgi:terpene synthase-like protein